MGLVPWLPHDPRLSNEENLSRLRAELKRRRRERAAAIAVALVGFALLVAVMTVGAMLPFLG